MIEFKYGTKIGLLDRPISSMLPDSQVVNAPAFWDGPCEIVAYFISESVKLTQITSNLLPLQYCTFCLGEWQRWTAPRYT